MDSDQIAAEARAEAAKFIREKAPERHDRGVGIVQGSHYRSGFEDGAAWWASRPATPATEETVTEEMVERAARAIHDAHHPVEGPVPEWDSDSDEWRSTYRDFARAALEAALGAEKGDDRG